MRKSVSLKNAMPIKFPKVNICDVFIDNVTMSDVMEKIDRHVRTRGKMYIVTPNVDHIVKLQSDLSFRDVYREASLVLADGMMIILASKFMRSTLQEKISGSDLFPKLCAVAADREYRLFFLGGRPGAAEQAKTKLEELYPTIKIVGFYSPPYGFENSENENQKIVDMINHTTADIVLVGLGAPKQEKWIHRFKGQYRAPVSIGIGVSFEFVAGMVRRAPAWMQGVGLEWLWRLIMEPRRLWKRYLIDDTQFFGLILRQKWKCLIGTKIQDTPGNHYNAE